MRESALFEAVLDRLRPLSTPERPIWAVGGAVRDRFLRRPSHDLDFTLPGPTRPVARSIADALGGGFYVLDEERDTTRVVLQPEGDPRLVLDFATVRGQGLEDDLRSRDFTLNALAYDVADPGRLIDPLGGLADLRAGILRACSPTSLANDPARVLRMVRQALSLQLRIDPATLHQGRAAAPSLDRISPERKRDEFFRILAGRRVSQAIQVLDHVGALERVLPELPLLKGVRQSAPHVSDVWEHTLAVTSHLERLFDALVGDYNEDAGADLMTGLVVMRLGRYRAHFARHYAQESLPDRPLRSLLFFAALYHDIAKPATRTVEPAQAGERVRFLGHDAEGAQVAARRARALALSSDEVSWVERIARHHMRVHFLAGDLPPADPEAGEDAWRSPGRRAIYRFFRASAGTGVDICLLSLADTRATYEVTLPHTVWLAELDVCRALLEAYWEDPAGVVSPPRYVNGNDLMDAFGIKPGPRLGRLLEAVRESQAAGEINSREEALDFARRWIDGRSIEDRSIEDRSIEDCSIEDRKIEDESQEGEG